MARMDFLEAQRKQIMDRLQELRPLHEEYLTLEKAQQALDQLGGPIRRVTGRRGPGRPPGRRTAAARTTTRRGPGRPKTRRTTKTTAKKTAARGRGGRPATRAKRAGAARRGGRKAGNTRADQAAGVVRQNPGITIPEIASKLGIRQNYLYRVMQKLQKERKVTRRNRGFYPAR
jgi:hypothetical protein